MINRILTTLALVVFAFFANAQCLEVQSIFANACGNDEGENEMVNVQVGATALNVADISVNWPFNSFIGWCQNAGTAATTASLNATITTSCGFLVEPTAGVLPAGANVLIITSENISLVNNSFEGLSDTVYIIYQCAGNTLGHFANGGTGIRILDVIVANSCIGTETVNYTPASLLGGDGATINYDPAGNATYVNNGCNAPVSFVSAGWSFTNSICVDYGIVDLNSLLAGGATTPGTWTGTNVTGSNFNPAGMYGIDSITYSVVGPGACPTAVDSTIVFFVDSNESITLDVQDCDSAFINGTWYTSNTTVVVVTPPADSYGCDSTSTINVAISSEIIDSTNYQACSSFTFNGTTYTTTTTLRDTLPGATMPGSSCSELFFSEYIEGSSNNKALEIYNGTGVPVNMANYTLNRYTNGGAAPSASLTLSGIVADGDVFVIASNSSSLDAAILAQADITDAIINHNGNDAYSLVNGATVVDIFGNIGCDPGTEWTDLGNGTRDNSYVRQANNTTGVTVDPPNAPCSFPSLNATNWISADAIDVFTNLGSHTANCSGGTISVCDTIVITQIDIQQEVNTSGNVTLCNGDSLFVGGAWQFSSGTFTDTFSTGGVGTVIDTFFFEDFEGVNTWTLNTMTGTNGVDNNFWVINDNEGGVAPGGCGVGGNLNNTLHITSVFNPTGGAAYDAGGLCGLLFCPETNRASSSANISTMGRTNISLGFDFIGNGAGLLDNGSVEFSANGGGAWTVVDPSLKSATCAGGQGLWETALYVLPTSAEGIPNLQVRFNWTNNDDGAGTDPSIAINDVYLTSEASATAACDSIITTNLTVIPTLVNTQSIAGCDSVVFNGTTYYTTIDLRDTIPSAGGCDSIINVTGINVLNSVTVQDPNNPVLICSTDSTQLPDGTFVNLPGTYSSVFVSNASCDSIVETIVQVQNCGCFLNNGLTFWAKGDTLVSNGGTAITAGPADNWGNIVNNPVVPDLNTTAGNSRTLIASDPDFNFNSSMDLVNSAFWRGGLPNDAVMDPSQGSMFVVATQPSLSLAFMVGTAGTGTCGGNRCSTGFRGNRSEFGSDNNLYAGTTQAGVANVIAMSGNATTSFQRNSLNGVEGTSNVASTIPASTATVNYKLGMGNWPGFNMTGKIAESMVFNRELSLDEYQRVESYLAVKYGVGLAHDYYASDWDGTNGTITWSLGSGYDNNIAGLGIDDCFGLEQIISHSVNPGAIVTMALTDNGGTFANPNSFDNDLEFLVWGNNGGTTNFLCSGNVPTGYSSIYQTEWLAAQTGNVGNTDIAFNIANGNLAAFTATLALVVDANNNGDYTDETAVMGSVVGTDFIFAGVDLDDGNTFTLVNVSDTTVTVFDTICNGSNYTLPGGTVVTDAGVYNDTLVGVTYCDSIVTTDLAVLPSVNNMNNVTICAGDSFQLPNGTFVSMTGAYADTFATSGGCDSIETINLTVTPVQNQTLPDRTICDNETAIIFGNPVNTPGVYTDTTLSATGCDSLIQTVELFVDPPIIDSVDVTLCDGDSLFVGGAFQTSNGIYLDTITGIVFCDIYQYTTLTFEPSPTADAGQDETINLGEEIVLTATGGVTYEWDNGSLGESILVAPLATTLYIVEVFGNGTCSDIDSVTVFVVTEEISILIPTGFSPNNDGTNDIFEIVNKEDFESIEMRVYNRWGELVHIATGQSHGWDGSFKGQDQPLDVYSYYVKVTPNNMTEQLSKAGNITLIR